MSDHFHKDLSLTQRQPASPLWRTRGVLFLWLIILAWRLFLVPSTQHIWVDFLFLFLLFGYIVLTAAGLGRIAARQFKLEFSSLEFHILTLLLGLGVVSVFVMVFGMLGLLTKAGIFTCLVITGFFASSEWYELVRKTVEAVRAIRLPHTRSIYEILILILITGLFPLLLINALTPAWDYDALLYHLEIPKQFLAQERIYFDPNIFRSAYPFLGEMLFLIGMIFRVEPLAKLVNLTYAILFILSTYAFAVRFFNRDVALTAVGILISTPIFLIWTTWVSIDFAWAVYEFWAVYAVCLWLAGGRKDTAKWLILAGVMSGLAASTKYISLPTLLILALVILWKSIADSKQPFVEAVRNLLIFGAAAGLVMGVWYIKNWIWTGNPIYPLLFGGTGWDPLKDKLFNNDYMKTFGLDRNLLNFILLPYNIYAQHNRFSTLPLEIIHPLLWLGFLFPFLKKSKVHSAITLYAFAYYVWWFFGSQVIRFLLPVSAFLVILAGAVLERCPSLLRNALRLTLIAGLMIFNVVYQISILRNSGTFSYVTDQISSDAILQNFVDDYRVKQFIQQSLNEDEKALFLWDGRGYYCDSRCIPDNDQSRAVRLVFNSPSPKQLAHDLRSNGITHLMLSSTDASWFIEYHDPNEYHSISLHYFEEQFLPLCGKSIYKDEGMELFEIICT